MTNSKRKGKTGELEAAALLREHGFEARRGQQYSGGTDSPDVVCSIPGIHIEVKRTERTDIYSWMEQATQDGKEKIPVVLHRKSREGWVVILRAEDFLTYFIGGRASGGA